MEEDNSQKPSCSNSDQGLKYKLEALSKQIQDDANLAAALSIADEPEIPIEDNPIILTEFERQILLDLASSDGLVVCAKGLYYHHVILNILKIYSDPANLVLVINSADWEEAYYKSKLDKKYVHEVANTATERERVYLQGGIQFISTRVLVVDLLKERIPVEYITGIIVLRANTIIESCQEAFALRLYRKVNKTGFIKAFSCSPEAFTIGYGHIDRIMRNLFVKELFIWPRFHATVQASLKPYEPQQMELNVPMSMKMTAIQAQILDIMNYLVREIKRINRSVDMEEITVENCVTKKFHKILQAQLDCIWYQLNSQTKLIVADLKILRNIMITTMYSDAVSAYALIKRYRSTEYVLSNSGWTLLDAAEQVFKISKERVYNKEGEFEPEPSPKWAVIAEILKVEIPGDMKRCKQENSEPPKVLILCQDTRSCFQLKQFLTQGAERLLLYTAMRQEVPIGKLSKAYQKIANTKELEISEKKNKSSSQTEAKLQNSQQSHKNLELSDDIKDGDINDVSVEIDELTQLLSGADGDLQSDFANFQESYMLTMTQAPFATASSFENLDDSSDDIKSGTNTEDPEKSVFEPFPEMENLDITAALVAHNQPLICIQTFKTENESLLALDRILEEMKPQYVIMYHCNVPAIRQLEVFEARQRRSPEKRIKVFFLMHNHSVEEQSYLTSLRREKQAFELIIETKSKMVIPEYQDGKTDEAFTLYKPYQDLESVEAENANTRKAGGQDPPANATQIPPRVVVDMREFRSDLPCLLHRRGIEIVPVTITIGDYILTPEICVERKSISDLIGSLNSGRLYNQCIQMQRFYAKPILLIEFNQDKPFYLQGKYMLSQNTTSTNADIVQKLQLLTIHFPRLRLIWSPNPYATAQLFEELKSGKEEPDAKLAMSLGADNAGGAYDDLKFNSNIYDFVLRLPGVNTRNVHQILRHGGNMMQLLQKSQTEISEMLESKENGKMLWDILHVTHLPEKDEGPTTSAAVAAGKKYGNTHNRFRRGSAAARGGASTARGVGGGGAYRKM